MPPAPRASRKKQRAFALLERASLAGALVAIMFAPSLAMAAEPLCRHPLAGASCAGVFSLVSLVYTTITAT